METVLLVDDNRLVKMMHERVLARAGYKVVTAVDGEEALKIIHQISPNVVVLDMMLPKVRGEQVLHAVKGEPATAHIPVIVVTGLSKKNAEKLTGAGADAFLEKEELLVSHQPLLDAVRNVLLKAATEKAPSPAYSGVELQWTAAEIESAVAASADLDKVS